MTIYDLAFLHEQATAKGRPHSPEEEDALSLAASALHEAERIVVRLGGKAGRLGECVIGSALLEGLLLALQREGRAGVPLWIVVDSACLELFDEKLYEARFWSPIKVIPSVYSEKMQAVVARITGEGRVLALDAHGGSDGMPALECEPDGATLLSRLFRVAVRSYAQRGSERRYADFIEELFSLPAASLPGRDVQPRILLSESDAEGYPLLAREMDLDPDALQIMCFFQSVVPAKCYYRWDEVMQLICADFARDYQGRKIDFLVTCGPDAELPAGVQKADLEEELAEFTGVNGNARVLVRSTSSLRDLAILTSRSALALSNDTGPGHIAGALRVPTITPFLPGNIYSKQVWSSSLWHYGATLEPNPYSYRELEAAVLWGNPEIINTIPPEELYKQISALLRDRTGLYGGWTGL